MSLRLASNRDMFAYLQSGNFQDPTPSSEVQWIFSGQMRVSTVYLDRYGYFQGQNSVSGFPVVRFDPEMVDSSSDIVGITDADFYGWFMGDYEPITGTQRIFTKQSSATIFQEQVYEDPLLVLDADPFPAIDTNGDRAGTGSGTIGYWTETAGSNLGNVVFFPEWGPGYALYNDGFVRHTDGVLYAELPFLVNLTTGFATAVDEIGAFPTTYEGVPANKYVGNKIFGEADTRCQNLQFLPDADSRHIAPKGRIFQSIKGLEPLTNEFRYYCMFYDWNPTGASGSPERIHLRLAQQTRCILAASASLTTVLPATPGRVITGMTNPLADSHMLFDNHRGRVVMFHSTSDARANPRTGCHNIIEFFQSAEVSIVRTPQSLAPPSTGRVVIFDTDTRGDLGEIIGGHVVNWTLEATSTEGEVLDVSGASPGDPIAVANPNINLTIDYAKTVYEDGTPLTEGVDFDWTATEVDFIGPKPIVGSEVYTVDYAHDAQVPALSGHGTLLNTTSITDAEGLAQCRVRYADDSALVGGRDRVTAQADP